MLGTCSFEEFHVVVVNTILILHVLLDRTGIKAMSRLLGIVRMNPEVDPSRWDHTEEERYGLGAVRTPEQFYETFGIDVVKKTTEDHMCLFVDSNGRRHKEFTPFLKPDGMGIDYSYIHFKWRDPTKPKRKEPSSEDDDESSAKKH